MFVFPVVRKFGNIHHISLVDLDGRTKNSETCKVNLKIPSHGVYYFDFIFLQCMYFFSSKNYVVSNNYTHEPKTNMKNNNYYTTCITYYSADY